MSPEQSVHRGGADGDGHVGGHGMPHPGHPAGSGPRLMMLEWHISRRCNLRCAFCYIDYSSDDELSDAECVALLEQLIEAGVPGIIFSGGEPLLRQGLLVDLVRRASAAGIRAVLATTGTLLDGSVLGKLKEAGLLMVGVSLDGATAEVHDRLRGVPGAFEKTLAAIETCHSVGVPVQVQTVVTRSTHREIVGLIGLSYRHGVRKHLVLDFVPAGRGSGFEDETLLREQRETLLDFVYHAHRLLGDRMVVEYVEPYWQRKLAQMEPERGAQERRRYFQGGTCMGGCSFLAIMPGGDVVPCPRFPIAAGNVRQLPFRDIWARSELLARFRDPSRLGGDCATCDVRDTLCDGCRARALHATGDAFGPDPDCIRRRTTEGPSAAAP